jgi:hypothetical protein
MREKKEFPIGVVLCIALILVLGVSSVLYLAYSLLFVDDSLTSFLSFSISSIVTWINVVLTILSLVIIPYGFTKRKNWTRIYAVVFLVWFAFAAMGYIVMTGDKIIGFPLFALDVLLVMYLLQSSVKRYFGTLSLAIVPSEIQKEFTYGGYTLYSKQVCLKNGKTQIIYFFCKGKPKSGSPIAFPSGFEVEVSKRSGLPFLKKRQVNPSIY